MNKGISKIKIWFHSNNSELVFQNDVEIKYSNGHKMLGRKYYFSANSNTYEIIVTDSGRYFSKNTKTKRSIGNGFSQKEFLNNVSNIFQKDYEEQLEKEIKNYFEATRL